MIDAKLDLRIRKIESGWEAAASCDEWSAGAAGNTPQRAILRLALALITRPLNAPRLERLFSVEDAAVRLAISDAENAVREIERQGSGGVCSVEQCQQAAEPTA